MAGRYAVAIEAGRRWLLAAALLALLTLLAVVTSAAWQRTPARSAASAHFVEVAANAYLLPKPDALADFRLVKHDGTPFHNGSLKGRWTFMIFGYTFCPDFCPTTLVEFKQVHQLLAAAPGGARDVQFVMVSVDPDRDTPALLSQYVPQFDPGFIGVTGDAAVIQRLADSVGAVFARVPGSRGNNYLIDHSTAVLLINPQGALQGVLAAPHAAKEMVQGYLKIRVR